MLGTPPVAYIVDQFFVDFVGTGVDDDADFDGKSVRRRIGDGGGNGACGQNTKSEQWGDPHHIVSMPQLRGLYD
jgi:hypothetical protein